jgi:hypothetical protein
MAGPSMGVVPLHTPGFDISKPLIHASFTQVKVLAYLWF